MEELYLEFPPGPQGQDPVNCGGCDGLILELGNPELTADGKGFILSTIESITQSGRTGVYVYKVSYDPELLANPNIPLRACDVKNACCRNCQVRYLESLLES